ncbi:hypothetical protein [Salinispora pacifica]|uniref:hypothetical protein n=1 Tax=Salinispora pacifica TaxID=351187 RepID=UPI0012BB5FFE|nr:hypothetical protein [Salinispora pacifica]
MNSSVDVSILAFLAAAFDAGAVLVEPRDLMQRSDRSAHDVNSALAAMCQHHPEVIRAVVVEDRVVAVTGLTVAGWHLATCLAVGLSGAPPKGRGVPLVRGSVRVLFGAVVAVFIRVLSDCLLSDD